MCLQKTSEQLTCVESPVICFFVIHGPSRVKWHCLYLMDDEDTGREAGQQCASYQQTLTEPASHSNSSTYKYLV